LFTVADLLESGTTPGRPRINWLLWLPDYYYYYYYW